MEHQAISAAGVSAFAFTVDRKAFVAALALAKRVTERRNTIPILSNVLLQVTSPDVLNIIATDLDLESRQEFPCDAPQPGAMTLNGETLKSTLGKMKGEFIRLEDMGANRVAVTDLGTGSTMRLPSLPADDFPRIAIGDLPAAFQMESASLVETVETVRPAVSTEETRYYLNGIFIHPYCESPRQRTDEHELLTGELAVLAAADQWDVDDMGSCWRDALANADGREEQLAARSVATFARAIRRLEIGERIDVLEAERTAPDALRFAATDGHRLFCYSRPLPAGAAAMPAGILPRKACSLVAHIVPKKGAAPEAHCAFSQSKFSVRVGRVTLVGKLIDGSFPDYTRVIPSDNPGKLAIPDASAFRAAAEGVAAVCTEKAKAIVCTMTGEYVTLYASSPEFGTSAMVVDGPSYSFDPGGPESVPMGVNAKYLLDGLAPFGSEAVEIRVAEGEGSPFRFYSDARPGLIIVLMPMRVGTAGFSPADIKRLTMDAVGLLRSEGPAMVAEIARLGGLINDPEHRGMRANLRAARTAARQVLGKLVTDAKPLFEDGSGVEGRWQAKRELAAIMGDERAERIAAAVLQRHHALVNRETFGSLAALASVRPAPAQPPVAPARPAPDVAPARPDVEPVRPAPVEAPRPAPEAEIKPQPEPDIAPPRDSAAAATGARVAKIADVHERVFYVLESDLLDESRTHVRRVHKDGTPFCYRESAGGGWQRIHRDNIARQILPRGTVDAPAKAAPRPAAPVADDNALAQRVAALEALVARLAGVDVGQPEPEAQPEPAVPDYVLADITARAQRYGIAQGDDEALDVFLTRLQGFEAMEREGVHSRERESTRDTGELRARIAELVDERSGADEAVRLAREEAEAAKADLAEAVERARQAVQRAAVLQVRCDALEGHAAASALLDRAAPQREPAEA